MIRKSPRFISLMAIIVLLVCGLVAWLVVSRLSSPAASPEKVTIGVLKSELSLLVRIAKDNGYFSGQGVDTTLIEYEKGTQGIDALQKGAVDVTMAAEFVFASNVLEGHALRTFGTIGSTNNTMLIVRKDRAIAQPSDLKGKRIGTNKGTSSDFFLSTFLALNGIHDSEVQVIDMMPAELAEALRTGKVDAVVAFSPFSFQVNKAVGGNVMNWPIQHEQYYYFPLITGSEFAKKRPEAATRIVRALLEAEAFLNERTEDEALGLLQEKLKIDREAAVAVRSFARYEVYLPQDLLVLLDDESRWLMQIKGTRRQMPNYFSLVDMGPLEAVKPSAVAIIH